MQGQVGYVFERYKANSNDEGYCGQELVAKTILDGHTYLYMYMLFQVRNADLVRNC